MKKLKIVKIFILLSVCLWLSCIWRDITYGYVSNTFPYPSKTAKWHGVDLRLSATENHLFIFPFVVIVRATGPYSIQLVLQDTNSTPNYSKIAIAEVKIGGYNGFANLTCNPDSFYEISRAASSIGWFSHKFPEIFKINNDSVEAAYSVRLITNNGDTVICEERCNLKKRKFVDRVEF